MPEIDSRQPDPESITVDQMKAALRRSEYLLEQRVRQVIEHDHTHMLDANRIYPNEGNGEVWNPDISASNSWEAGPNPGDIVSDVLLCQCVKNSQPLVFLSYESNDVLVGRDFKYSGIPTHIMDDRNGAEIWGPLLESLKIDPNRHFCPGVPATQYCSFQTQSMTKEWKALHLQTHHRAFENLVNSLESQINDHYRYHLVFGSSVEAVSLDFYYPIVVLQGKLLLALVNRDSMKFVESQCIQYRHFSRKHQETYSTYSIDVITELHLPTHLNNIKAEMRRISSRVRRNNRRVQKSIDLLAERLNNAGDHASKRKVLNIEAELTGN